MADECVVSDIVTKFLLNTCRLHTQITKHAIQAALQCAELATYHPHDNAEADFIPLLTGSAAEFYIEPMLPHFGDIDVMYHLRLALRWQYHGDIHHQHSYQLSSATMSEYLRL